MGFENRPYYRDSSGGYGGGQGGGPRISLGFPSLTPTIKKILIINCLVFVGQMILPRSIQLWFVATGQPPVALLHVWRLISFQFLHANFMHLFINMLLLYFFGTSLERTWGSKKLLYFYLTCGFIGGLLFEVASAFGAFHGLPLVGASGGVLGVMAACAVLFPQMKVYVYFLFPIPIRVLILLITIGYIANVLGRFDNPNSNAGGDLCHLGGMATGFLWIFSNSYFASFRQKTAQGAFQAKMKQQQQLQFEVDRILSKVREQGIQSLTRKEKQTLERATEEQKQRGKNILG